MFKMKKLEELKKQIIDKLVTEKSVEEIKNKKMLKGGFLKQFFKYVFFKKFKIKENMDSVDLFFTDGSIYNQPKIFSTIYFGTIGLSILVGSYLENAFSFLITSSMMFFILFFILYPVSWYNKNKNINDKFNPKNLAKIKETIFDNYNEKERRQLLSGYLTKDEMVNIFEKIKELVGEEYFLSVFNNLKLYKEGKDISDPYVLLSVIDEIIKNKEKIDHENEEIEKNKKIIKSLLKEENKIRERINV